MIKTVLGLVGIGGAGISSGWLIAGAVVAIMAVLGGTWTAGYRYRDATCDAAALKLENERLQNTINENKRQLDSVNRIQQRDTDRAADLERQNSALMDQIINTPVNNAPCLDSGAADRVFGKRNRPAVRGPKYPASPAGR